MLKNTLYTAMPVIGKIGEKHLLYYAAARGKLEKIVLKPQGDSTKPTYLVSFPIIIRIAYDDQLPRLEDNPRNKHLPNCEEVFFTDDFRTMQEKVVEYNENIRLDLRPSDNIIKRIKELELELEEYYCSKEP